MASNRLLIVGDAKVGKKHILSTLLGRNLNSNASAAASESEARVNSEFSLPIPSFSWTIATKYYNAPVEVLLLPHRLSSLAAAPLDDSAEQALWLKILASAQALMLVYDRHAMDRSFSDAIRALWQKRIESVEETPDCMLCVSNSTKSSYATDGTAAAAASASAASAASSTKATARNLAMDEADREESSSLWASENRFEYVFVSFDADRARQTEQQRAFIVNQGGHWDDRERRQMDRVVEALQCAQWPKMERSANAAATAPHPSDALADDFDAEGADADAADGSDDEKYAELGGGPSASSEPSRPSNGKADAAETASEQKEAPDAAAAVTESEADRLAQLADGDEDGVEALELLLSRMRALRSSAQSGTMSDAERRHQAESLIMQLISRMGDEDGDDDEIEDTAEP